MNIRLFFCLAACAWAGRGITQAETVWDSADKDPSVSRYRQRVGVSYRMNYNVSTKFGNLGGFAARSNPGPATGSNVDRTYDNGFNRVDVSGNAGGQTWFWGYNDASQIVGDSVVMSSRSSPGNREVDASDDPQHGLEVTYNLELGRKAKWRWGLEAAGNYAAVSVSDNQSFIGGIRTVSDAFALNGITPPLAPYAGTFNGPGPVIGSTPTRTVTTSSAGASIRGNRDLDACMVGGRLGPYLEIPLSRRTALSFSGGLAVVGISSDFDFDETVTIPGVGTAVRSGSSSDDAILAGGYVAGNFIFNLTEQFSLFSGIQYYNLGTHTQHARGKSAELDLRNSLGVVIGGTVSF